MNIHIDQPQILKMILETNLQVVVLFSGEAYGGKVQTYEGFLDFIFIFIRNRVRKRDIEVESDSP